MKKMDSDKSGSITFEEFNSSSMARFKLMDSNGDGNISQEEFLIPSIKGEMVASVAISEPGGGSDVSALKTNCLEYIRSLTSETRDIKTVCYQLAENDQELLQEMADLYQFEIGIPTKRAKLEEKVQETSQDTTRSLVSGYRNWCTNAGQNSSEVLRSIVER